MKSYLLWLLLPFQLFAQPDSIEDDILQKIELGDPAWDPQEAFLQRPSVLLSDLDRKGDYFYRDSLYRGVILEPIYDSLFCLLGCDGYLTGEKMIRQRFHRDSAFRTVYYSEAAPSFAVFTVRFTSYYPNGNVKSTGMDSKKVYPHFESFFGSDEPDGTFAHYYENGQLQSSYTKRKRQFDGEHLEYYANGQLKEQRFYELGRPAGTWRQYTETGKKTGKLKFTLGRGHGRWNGQKVNGGEF
jgi:hypothetical protein